MVVISFASASKPASILLWLPVKFELRICKHMVPIHHGWCSLAPSALRTMPSQWELMVAVSVGAPHPNTTNRQQANDEPRGPARVQNQ